MDLTADRAPVSVSATYQNRMLARLAGEARTDLLRLMVPVDLPAGMVLSEPGHMLEHVYFPVSGLIATNALTHAGESVLVTLIGREGFAGWCGLLDHPQMMHAVTVHTPGRALRARVGTARDEFARGGTFTRLVHGFMYAQTAQMSQSVLCNRLHAVDQRLARWLLTMCTLAESDRLLVTHEALAHMLGSRRSTVTVAATQLQDAGLIDYRRGKVRIVDAAGLARVACECYRQVHEVYERVLGGD